MLTTARYIARMRNLGKAWVVLEESFHSDENRLIALLSARKTARNVAEYIEQAYVDRFADFDEKIDFKKGRKSSPYRIHQHMIMGTTFSHGHDPMYNAYYAHELQCLDEILIFRFRVFKGDFENREVTERCRQVGIA